MGAMNKPSNRTGMRLHPEIDHPNVGETNRDEQTCQTLGIAQVAFVKVKPATFLVREKRC